MNVTSVSRYLFSGSAGVVAATVLFILAIGLQTQAETASGLLIANATREHPWENSLAMKFVPVPIVGGPTNRMQVLFSIWDTRVQDYQAFVNATGRLWARPFFKQGLVHPAVNVSWDDAVAFCQWLTEREHKSRRLPADWSYRLPSDHEWSCAVGIGGAENAAKTPKTKNEKINGIYLWGKQSAPPRGAGNYTPVLSVDRYEYTSPVGSFSPNKYGLYDMGGNVGQWCGDWYDKEKIYRVVRGASWCDFIAYGNEYLLASHRSPIPPASRLHGNGFRVVVAGSASARHVGNGDGERNHVGVWSRISTASRIFQPFAAIAISER